MVGSRHVLAIFAAALVATVCTPALAIDDSSDGWVTPRDVPAPDLASTTLEVHLHFLEPRIKELYAHMLRVAEKGGAWLTPDQLRKYVALPKRDLARVRDYLAKQGVTDARLAPLGDEMYFSAPVRTLEKMFSTKFVEAAAVPGGPSPPAPAATYLHAEAYRIPPELAKVTRDVGPYLRFSWSRRAEHLFHSAYHHERHRRRKAHARPDAAWLQVAGDVERCDAAKLTVGCLRRLYGVGSPDALQRLLAGGGGGGGAGAPAAAADLVVVEVGRKRSSLHPDDLHAFLDKLLPAASNATVDSKLMAGAATEQGDGTEFIMPSVEVAVGVSWPLKVQHFAVGQEVRGDGAVYAWRQLLNGPAEALPGVLALDAPLPEDLTDTPAMVTMCNTAMKLAALGTTIVASPGDFGVSNTGLGSCPPLHTDRYSSCEFVTSVGAAAGLPQNLSVMAFPAARPTFYSGAGLSRRFDAPVWQRGVVSKYLGSANPRLGTGDYNLKGRAYPDVSVMATNVSVVLTKRRAPYINGTTVSSGGGVASAAFSALVAVVNSARGERKKSRLGWLNPRLYKHPEVMLDVKAGGSYGCRGDAPLGFPAGDGFDVASGLGVPDPDKWVKAMVASP